MFTKIFLKRYNFIMSLLSLLFIIYIVFMNFYILHLGKEFADDYNASSYEVTYRTKFEPKELSAVDGTSFTKLPSRFMFYDKNGDNLIVTDNLAYEYHNLNMKVLNMEETYAFLGSLTFVLFVFGLLLCARNRYNVSGYIFLIFYTLITGLKFGILNVLAVLLVVSGIFGSILVYRTRFVDWNENIFLSFSKKNKCCN